MARFAILGAILAFQARIDWGCQTPIWVPVRGRRYAEHGRANEPGPCKPELSSRVIYRRIESLDDVILLGVIHFSFGDPAREPLFTSSRILPSRDAAIPRL